MPLLFVCSNSHLGRGHARTKTAVCRSRPAATVDLHYLMPLLFVCSNSHLGRGHARTKTAVCVVADQLQPWTCTISCLCYSFAQTATWVVATHAPKRLCVVADQLQPWT